MLVATTTKKAQKIYTTSEIITTSTTKYLGSESNFCVYTKQTKQKNVKFRGTFFLCKRRKKHKNKQIFAH